jgi:hypothetical protein
MSVICFDLDNTLCKTIGTDYKNSTPIQYRINRVNELYKKNTIIIFTGRGSVSGINWRALTKRQLKQWGIKCHKLILGKPAYDFFIDDKALNVESWDKLATL